MKTILSILIFSFIFSLSSLGQVFPLMPKYYHPIDSSAVTKDEKKDEVKKETLMKRHDKVSYSVAVGTGYTSFGNNMSMMNSYIAPSIDYQVNSKLNFSFTGIIMQNNMNGFENFYGSSPYGYNTSPTNYGIFGTAYYQLNNKWSVWGDGAYMENQSVFNDYRSEVYNTDFKTISVGVGYQVNDKVSFNFQYRYSNGLNPAYNYSSSFYNPAYSPFHLNRGYWDY